MSLAFRQAAVVIGVSFVWALGSVTGVFNPDVLPPVPDVAREMVALWSTPAFKGALWATLRDGFLGAVAAAVVAIPLGLLIGIFPAFELSTRKILDFGRAFPVVALLPLFVLIIGANSQMKVLAIAIACFFPILVQTVYGARRLDPTILDTVRIFRIPFGLRFFRVILPSALPYIATGLRIATTVSILVAVGTEVILPIDGLGYQINLSRIANRVPEAFAYVIYAGLLGVLLTLGWELLEKRLLPWHLDR